MNFNEAQSTSIFSDKPLLLISAGAGSGKTRVLTERFVYLCEVRYLKPDDPLGASVDEIVAITFTEKAAREMKDRIRKRMNEKEQEATSDDAASFWREQKELLESAMISTFHSFCQRLLSQYALQADLPPRIRILDEVEGTVMKRDILLKLLEEKERFQRVYPLFQFMSKQQLVETIEQLHNEITELTIGEDTIEQLQVEEMLRAQSEARVEERKKVVHSFHHHARNCIERFPDHDELSATVKKHMMNIEKAIASASSEEPEAYMEVVTEAMPSRTNKAWAEQSPALYELYEEHWKPLKEMWKKVGGPVELKEEAVTILEVIASLVKEFHLSYNRAKKRAALLDFTDLQQKAVRLLQDPHIQLYCQRQFRHMMIDEFQDTNRLQLEVLNRIKPLYQFIVGDQKQSIYRFRGANVRLMNEMEEKANREETAQAILMNENYRTVSSIIHVVNKLFSGMMVHERTEDFQTVYAPLIAHRHQTERNEKRVEWMKMLKVDGQEETQYDQLANRMVAMIEAGEPLVGEGESNWREPSWGDMAILIPSRTNLLLLEQALTKKNVPYVISGGIGFFERQEVMDYLTMIRWLTRPFEDIHLLALLRSPILGLKVQDFFQMNDCLEEGQALYELVYEQSPQWSSLSNEVQTACLRIQSWMDKWIPFKEGESLVDSLMEIFAETDLRASLLLQDNGLQKVKNVEKVIQWMVDRHEVNLEAILTELDIRIEMSEKEGDSEVERVQGDVVQIMTIHASKGLEFPIVFLPQVERSIRKDSGRIRFHSKYGFVLNLQREQMELGQKPEVIDTPGFEIVKSMADAEAIEESKRLFYVATTRARDYLYLIGEEANGSHTWMSYLNETLEDHELEHEVVMSETYEPRYWKKRESSIHSIPVLKEKRQAPLSLTVSEIMTFIHNPNQYYQQFVVGVPFSEEVIESGQGRSGNHVSPSRLGTLVHRACELRDYGLSPIRAVELAVEEVELEDALKYKKEIEQIMERYSEKVRQSLGAQIANEWSFVTFFDGVEIIGEIDKVVEKNGQIHLYDFKTNQVSTRTSREWLDYYKPQLYLYRYAYEKETNEKVATASLYIFKDEVEPIHPLIPHDKEEKEIFRALRNLIVLRQRGAGREEYARMSEMK
ncbi:exodeoxyribonuclease V subunit beta [Halalkalibacter sp. APA_J-10(15)]|uniref:UvrD-helicase domain-containing protein n=1 Tax=Halalkalibacter sp. APA_J-10(15) TaxID=2933805 RepID=UPI001FF60106|nr:UvrD-helicase domain-containing protein [Halalkalibacter sp. APA_J-10(15)]MCK0473510.1 UvrD-helicase domain-containing protein [Halalkalibacter sp. APA_J-10(15)]